MGYCFRYDSAGIKSVCLSFCFLLSGVVSLPVSCKIALFLASSIDGVVPLPRFFSLRLDS